MVVVRLVEKRNSAGKGVVRLADEVRVTEGLSAELWRQVDCEVAEVAKLRPDVDRCATVVAFTVRGGKLIQQDAEKSLGAASVLDGLRGKEDS